METRDDDLASIVLALEERMSRADIAASLGVGERDVDEIASGYLPAQPVADRLRDLAGAAAPAPKQAPPRLSRTLVVAFVLADILFFAIVAAVVLLR